MQVLTFVFDQNLFVVLLQKFKFNILFLKVKIHDRRALIDVYDGHRHYILNLFEHQHHNPVAYLELKEIIVPEHIEHFIRSQIPNSKTFIDGMLGDHFVIQVVHFDKVWILQGEVLE